MEEERDDVSVIIGQCERDGWNWSFVEIVKERDAVLGFS